MTTLCTLFDHNYLDKGLALYESLEKVCSEFELYVLCMSDRCYEILTDLNYLHLKPIKLVDFEDEELLRVKPTRGVGEYCWTCSSSLIRYILMTYNPDYCTYIDADIFFYSDPHIIIEEMERKNASVQIIGHRFPEDSTNSVEIVGKYCVEFDTFKNDDNGLMLVNHWRNQCLEHCSLDGDGIHWGDQKYQDPWCDDYDFCIETENLGAGVAPWNYSDYRLVSINAGCPIVKIKGIECPLVFYHFENLKYLDRKHIQINIYKKWGVSSKLADIIYPEYLKCVDKYKDLLESEYGVSVIIKKHLGVKPFKLSVGYVLKKLPNVFTLKFYKYLESKLLAKYYAKKSLIEIP